MCYFSCGKYSPANNSSTLHYSASLHAGSSAGGGTGGYADGPWDAALFAYPSNITFDSTFSNLLVTDSENHLVRNVNTTRSVSTIAGTIMGSFSYYSSPVAANTAYFGNVYGIAIHPSTQEVYLSSSQNTIYKLSGGNVTSYAGETTTGAAGFQDGYLPSYGPATPGNIAHFGSVTSLKFDTNGDLYLSDLSNSAIRKINMSASPVTISTIAGGGPSYSGATGYANGYGMNATFDHPKDIALSSVSNHILYVCDTLNNIIRKVDMANGNLVTTFAGGGAIGNSNGYQDGTGTAALFDSPTGLLMDSHENLFVSDSGNNSIRRISANGVVETLIIDNTNLVTDPGGMTIDQEENIYVINGNHAIIKLTPIYD